MGGWIREGDTIRDWTVVRKEGRSDGKTKYVFRHACGYEQTDTSDSIRRGRVCRVCGRGGNANTYANICFNCQRATGYCSWSRDFTPVEGWTATPTEIGGQSSYGERRSIPTYSIAACPQFLPDERLLK